MSTFEIYYQSGLRNRFFRPLSLSHQQYQWLTRLAGLIFCLLILPILALPMALIALAIVIDSPGAPIFSQERAGYRGHRFKMYKFRTMYSDHDDPEYRAFMRSFVAGENPEGAEEGDRVAKFKPIQRSDVTRVGRILRKTSLDELPQIFNVIKGDMRLIGPRPNVLWEVEAYKPWHHERLDAIPGITGLAQVMGRSEISFDVIARYDIQYVRNQALELDFWIVLESFKAIIGGNGAG
jgi:lipopolysaccharide/colanic/teichoic acid biosynthesis glycosyltransferase